LQKLLIIQFNRTKHYSLSPTTKHNNQSQTPTHQVHPINMPLMRNTAKRAAKREVRARTSNNKDRSSRTTTTTKPSLKSKLLGSGTNRTDTRHTTGTHSMGTTGRTTRSSGIGMGGRSSGTGMGTRSSGMGTGTRSSGLGMGRRGNATTTGTTGVHQQRETSMGDKVSGMMMKLKGSVTNKPGVKVCCTRF
jgi:hypothetical protein